MPHRQEVNWITMQVHFLGKDKNNPEMPINVLLGPEHGRKSKIKQ